MLKSQKCVKHVFRHLRVGEIHLKMCSYSCTSMSWLLTSTTLHRILSPHCYHLYYHQQLWLSSLLYPSIIPSFLSQALFMIFLVCSTTLLHSEEETCTIPVIISLFVSVIVNNLLFLATKPLIWAKINSMLLKWQW